MTSGTPPVRPLDALRAELRAEGYTDDEISKLLIDRKSKELAQPQPQGAAATGMTGVVGQPGIMSGVLNNLSVAMAMVGGFLPSIANDIANLFGAHSSLHQRSRAGVFLAAKLALVAAIAFAIYQEYQQHIISQTKITEQQAINVTEQAKNAAPREEATARGSVADAEIKEATAREALRRQKAEADKAQAEACSARADAAAKNTNMLDFLNGYSNDALVRECDPNDAQRQACDAKFKAIFAPVDSFTFKGNDPINEYNATFLEKLKSYRAECPPLTEAQKKYGQEKVDFFVKQLTGKTPARSSLPNCDAKFKAIFDPIDTFTYTSVDPRIGQFNASLWETLRGYRNDCPQINEANKRYMQERMEFMVAKLTDKAAVTQQPPKSGSLLLSDSVDLVCKGTYLNFHPEVGDYRYAIDYIKSDGVKLISTSASGYKPGEETIFDNQHHFHPNADTDDYVKITSSLVAYGKKWTDHRDHGVSTLDYTISRVTGVWIIRSGNVTTVVGYCDKAPAMANK